MKKAIFIFCLCCGTLCFMSAQQNNPSISESTLSEFQYRLLGPSMPAGRAWRVVGLPDNPKTMYVTTAGGGIWKTVNNGTTFKQIFTDESSASTSEIAIAKSNNDILWVGTGEAANTRANSIGDGIYKSLDAGETWQHMGLKNSQMIGGIVIHPENPDIVMVAAMGHLWGTNEERGLFRTTNGGETWTKVLYIDDTTGFSTIKIDPKNPNIVYATAWQRTRFGGGDMDESGPNSGIFKSVDGGVTWKKLTEGLPTDDTGKIELAIAHNNTNIIYAAILTGEPIRGGRTSKQGGIFRTDDGGGSWVRVNEDMTSYYYDHIYVDPTNDETVWMPVYKLSRSTDGGKTFSLVNMRHVHFDLHSMWIDPNDTDHMAISGDGGVSITYDGAKTWQQTVLPIGQFYEVSVDNQQPYHVIGGMQDTGHWRAPNRTYDDEGLTTLDWSKLRYVGDGMASATDPRDPNIIYVVQQFGNCSRLDLRTWDRTELKPTDIEELKQKGATHSIRYNWTPGFLLSEHDPDYVYLGSNYLFRINAKSGAYEVISPDLSLQQDKTLKGINDGYHSYGSIFSIAESSLDDQVLWTGADDGPIWLSTNKGDDWKRVDTSIDDKEAKLGVVAEIETSKFDKQTTYVVYDGHARDDMKPHVYKTTDNGTSWQDIAGDLPEFGPAYVIKEDPTNPQVLYLGTEFGVYVSLNQGGSWTKLKNNLPTAAVRTMAVQERDSELVIGTFGSAIWALDIAPFSEMTSENLDKPAFLFKVKPAINFKQRVSFGNSIEEINGDMFFRAENPPMGTMITYRVNAKNDDVKITITDKQGNLVRTLAGNNELGIHKINWDLRSDETINNEFTRSSNMTPSEFAYSQRVPLGDYTVRLSVGNYHQETEVSVIKEPQAKVEAAHIRK
ncbi:VPS10 domain-containing protein [Allomuricauda sp. F6463D]|uniref:VPS10 domain-containing protein n=1 Tax=Allomuricauda sp. F6463D TaxID=2926409 RepID=UPI001FF2CA4D|nr:hypothetical protein [Muricauda sp. F6463D]MCK0159743.1 hypothetical protein [Muricauda sp. F6463D]